MIQLKEPDEIICLARLKIRDATITAGMTCMTRTQSLLQNPLSSCDIVIFHDFLVYCPTRNWQVSVFLDCCPISQASVFLGYCQTLCILQYRPFHKLVFTTGIVLFHKPVFSWGIVPFHRPVFSCIIVLIANVGMCFHGCLYMLSASGEYDYVYMKMRREGDGCASAVHVSWFDDWISGG